MNLLPSFQCDLFSGRTPEDIRIILNSVTVAPKKRIISLFGPSGGDFSGQVSASGFEFVLVLWYKNSYNPIIRGFLTADGEGTKIHIDMRMNKFTSGFSVFWFGGVFFFFLCGVLGAFSKGVLAALPLLLGPAMMFVFGQLIMRYGFYRPAEQSLKRIIELTGAEEIHKVFSD